MQVEEAGPGDVDPFEVPGAGPVELLLDPGGDVAWRHAHGLGQLERDVGGEVAVRRVLRRRQLDARRRRGEAARVERGLDCGEELVTDHEEWRRSAPFAARRARAW